ncbi:MAG: hypothetical protein EBR82_30905 [Caulobacteraceae bacterium]|nr:hypothetical protein [Caulobacteraceae bacterium]
MTTTFSLLPYAIDLEFVRGDEVPFTVVFNGTDLTNYGLTSSVYIVDTGTYSRTRGTVSELVVPTVTKSVSVAAGTVTTTTSTVSVRLTEQQTSLIPETGNPRWYLRWIDPSGVTRTILSGNVSASNP